MTRRILSGATRDSNGVRVCPLKCNGETHCKAAKSKSGGAGVTMYEQPLPGMCAMFYDLKTKEPT